MGNTGFLYLVFSLIIVVALVFDLGLLSKKNQVITIKTALVQTLFWVFLSFAFCVFIWFRDEGGTGKPDAISFLSAYLLEWSLSIDNIFVFIIIFTFFGVKEKNYSRVLLAGILMAIIFRIIFIAAGSELVARFDWIMYVFGVFLVYTGVKMFGSNEEEEFAPDKNWAFKLLKKIMRTTDAEPDGRFVIVKSGRLFFTKLAMVVVMLGLIDIVFALDSIPAVFSVIPDPGKKMLIYSSNIFAVLGLRSLFFLLRGAANKFNYLQQGIAVVLLFIGIKMLIEKWIHFPVWVSLLVIVFCIGSSIFYSVWHKQKNGSVETPE
ncbi:MAG: Tellurium resistance protein TerC [Ferruginibacter sp.]|uniref:TerC/Alx family metal homeostasis membrane protein n=1 Tax=Ferruginibacter sp. TaxID=1940288 RepID=UPI002659D4D9|nr:TerC/Alx family metal homeostasis membrane protein [Ferruginibacter sp.]MDB5276033.1 Tellurium resistance protein TerC [Ferruginibacter sp.]